MHDRVGGLKEPRFADLSEVGYVAKVGDRVPARTKLAKATHPHTSTLLVRAFGEDGSWRWISATKSCAGTSAGGGNLYGQKYEILGTLTGPNVNTAWVRRISI